MTFKKIVFVLSILSLGVFQSCSLSKVMRFAECEFVFKEITKLEATGISIKDKSSVSSLSFMNAAKLAGAFAKEDMQILLDLDLLVKNPNTKEALLNRVDYIVLLDGEQILDGTTNERISVPGGGSSTLPLKFNFDLFQVLSGKSTIEVGQILWDLAADTKHPKNMKIKIKPYFTIAKQQVKYPGYISVMKL